jgi:hypothetical protein
VLLIRAFLRCHEGRRDCRHNSPGAISAASFRIRRRGCAPTPREDIHNFARGCCYGRRARTRQSVPIHASIGVVEKLETFVTVLSKYPALKASREATHDSDRAAGQTIDVVPDGTRQMAGVVAGQQSLQSRAVESAEKRTIPDFFPAAPLAASGEVLSMFRLGMHDVEMGRQECENGILRLGRQSTAKFVFRLVFLSSRRAAAHFIRHTPGGPYVSRSNSWSTSPDRGAGASFG